MTEKYIIVYNFFTNYPIDLIFGHREYMNEGNILCKFGENLTRWRHMTSFNEKTLIFLKKKCWRQQKCPRYSKPSVIFLKAHFITFY